MVEAYGKPALVAEKGRQCALIAQRYSWEAVTRMLLHETSVALSSVQ
jgi:hypothetical protein